MINVLIIEDEAKTARELANMLKHIDDTVNVIAILDSVEQALQWFGQNKQPDLIFSDIQLADGLCFEIYNKIQVTSPIIFCTAFDEYLMNAFDTNAVSYLLKPITREKVEKAFEKFHSLKSVFDKDKSTTNITGLLQQLKYNYKTALLVNQKEKIIPIQVKDIAFFYLDKTIVNITTLTNQKYYLSSTLDEIEKMIDPVLFYRANRQFLINKNAITNAERFFARKLVAKLLVSTPETIIVSKAKASEFLQWLEG
jgi:two-component system LytT family response regulator